MKQRTEQVSRLRNKYWYYGSVFTLCSYADITHLPEISLGNIFATHSFNDHCI